MRNCGAFPLLVLCAGFSGFFGPGNVRCAETPLARLSAAQALPCSTAIAVYQSLSADTTAPDSVRSRAFGLLGDYGFAQGVYETAGDNYRKASALDKKEPRYVYRAGLSYLAGGDTADAIKLFTEIAEKSGPDLSNEARVILGRISYTRGDYTTAMDYFRQTGIFKPTNGWSVAASFGKLLCARELGLADSAAFYEKQLSPYSKTLLEKEAFAKIKGLPVVKKGDTAAAAIGSGKKTARAGPIDSGSNPFTLQVGAFASESSALAMKKNLSKKFKEVSCVTAIVSARTFYRVWVGDFKTHEAAEKFGQNELMQLGLVYRVVTK